MKGIQDWFSMDIIYLRWNMFQLRLQLDNMWKMQSTKIPYFILSQGKMIVYLGLFYLWCVVIEVHTDVKRNSK